jgi:hypothetical protein
MPDNAIPHLEAQTGENRIQHGIKRNNGATIYVISDLPANAPLRGKAPYALLNDCCLLVKV